MHIKRVVGIGVAETIEIAWANFDEAGEYEGDVEVLSFRNPDMNSRARETDVNSLLNDILNRLKRNRSYSFLFDADTVAVSFSSIGRVNRERHRLERIMRKNWTLHPGTRKSSFHIDFGAMKRKFANKEVRLFSNNDASCAVHAEHQMLRDETSLFFITVNEGVNVGVINQGFELDRVDHPEFGHSYPQIHPDDFRIGQDRAIEVLAKGSCPSHPACYEALASGRRIRISWGGSAPGIPKRCDLGHFQRDHEAWDKIAYYLAQLCLAGQAMFSPNRILLGGTVLWGNPIQNAKDLGFKKFSVSPKPHSEAEIAEEYPHAMAINTMLLPAIRNHYIKLRKDYPLSKASLSNSLSAEKRVEALIQRGSVYKAANPWGAIALARAGLFPLKPVGLKGGLR